MMNKCLVQKLVVLLLLYALVPDVRTYAATELLDEGSIVYYKQDWQGQEWLMSELVMNSKGDKIPASFVNDSGNLELFSMNETSHDRVYAQFPYSVNENGSLNEYDVNNQLAFMNDANFDMEFRMRYEGSVGFIVKWYHGLVRLEFKENRLTVLGANDFNETIGIKDDGEWHDYAIKVRGNRCDDKSSAGPDCVRYVSVFMDGTELYNFYSERNPAAYRSYKFFIDNDYDQKSWAEVESVSIINRASSVKINSHKSGDVLEAGQDITITANAGASDGEEKLVDFYVGDIKIGSGINYGIMSTSVSQGGCDDDKIETTPTKDASITLNDVPAGVYVLKAVCDGEESSEVTLFVKNTFEVTLSAPEHAMNNETINLNVATRGCSDVEKVEYFVNGVRVAESNEGVNYSVMLSNLPTGSAYVIAKVYSSDGTAVYSNSKIIKVETTDVSDIEFNREYEIGYTVADEGVVNIKDGYFELALIHSGGRVSYKDETGIVKTYDNELGAGEYKIVVTAGSVEVYYNGQFVFSYLMPLCYDEQSIEHEGTDGFTIGGTGTKPTYIHKDWEKEKEVFSETLCDFGQYFSLEFDKKDTSHEKIEVYDGIYEVSLSVDGDEIWVKRQPTVGASAEEYKVSDSVEIGYYRVTVAEGMAQIFCNNRILGTWRCPVYVHRPAVVRTVTNPNATSFVSLKGIDDVYYHNENFEGNQEKGFTYEDYWFDESDARIETGTTENAQSCELVAENGNTYLKMTGEGTRFLNVMAHDPSFKWKSYFEGNDGGFSVRFRHAVKYDYSEIGYSVENAQWYARNSVKKLIQVADTEDSDGDGNTTEIVSTYYDSELTELQTSDISLDAGWHEFELIFDGNDVKLLCDATEVISATGFSNAYGRIGFAITGDGVLGIDDVEYSGEGKVTAGLSYLTDGRSDFYRNFKGQIIAASVGSGTTWYSSEDNGETWAEVKGNDGEWLGTRSCNNLRLLSGKFLRVRYNGAYDYAYLYDSTSYTGIKATAKGTEYTPAKSEGACVQAPGSMDGIPHSGMPSRLMQIQSGPYKGRVIYCRGGSGETYGRTYMFWSDDYDGVDDPAPTAAVWNPASVQLSYFNTGYNIQESQMVDMPDGTLRYYVRTELGHLAYFTSSDGGESWDSITEMKTENLITSMCCYSIQRKGDTDTYYSFWEYDLTTANSLYAAAPRNRRALAVSYDGMQTWEYVADIEEETLTAEANSKVCNHGMRYIDGAVYMSYYHSNDLHKMFRIDENKIKPLKRFTAPHYRTKNYATVGAFANQKSVIPKESGESYIYDNYVYADVNGEGFVKAAIMAKVIGAECYVEDDTVTFRIGDGFVEFMNDSATYTVNGEAFSAAEVCCDDGYINVDVAAKIFGKTVYENNSSYVIANNPLSAESIEQIENLVVVNARTPSRTEMLLKDINGASAANDSEKVRAILDMYSDVLEFEPNTEHVPNPENIYNKMTGIRYYCVEDIKKVFLKGVQAQQKSESLNSDVALSTVSNGFEQWVQLGKNTGNVMLQDDVAMLDVKMGEDPFVYGTPGLEFPEDKMNFAFDCRFGSDYGNTDFRIANGEYVIQIEINPESISVYTGVDSVTTEISLKNDMWYTFSGVLKKTDKGMLLCLSLKDRETVTCICDNKEIKTKNYMEGFWVEFDGTCEMEVQLKNVRVYEGKALDVISYKQTDGKASAVVDFLNDENPVFGCTVTETERVLVEEDFSKSVDFTDGQRFSRVTSLDDADYVVEIVDEAMHYRKALSGNKSLEQRILIPKYENTASANDIVFEYDLMLPDKTTWTQTVDTAFMYFDIYIKHPVKPLRQTMYIQNDRLKVGSMVFAFRDICKTLDYDGKWMSFRHRYYFENEEWKCDFLYRQREESEWKTVKNAPMNASTNSNNFIRFYAYPEDQVEICVDNIKVINTGKDVHSGQLVMGLYHNGYMAGIGYTESFTDTVQPYGTRRFVLEDVGYAENNDIIPDAKFFVWNNLDEKIPLTDAVEVKSNLFNKEQE